MGEVGIVGHTPSLTLGSILLADETQCMNVARQAAKQLLLPAAMILFGTLLWLGVVDRVTALVVMMLFLVAFSFRAGRLSTAIWPRQH